MDGPFRWGLSALALTTVLATGAVAQDDPSLFPTEPTQVPEHTGEWREVEDLVAESYGMMAVSGATGASFAMRRGAVMYFCFAASVGLPIDAGAPLPVRPPVPRVRCVLAE